MGKDKPFVVFVLGATASSKSKIAEALAEKYDGELVNCDSMQVYKGLRIATNQDIDCTVTTHCINYVDPVASNQYHLNRFQDDACCAIDDIVSRGKLPIVVGGTHFYALSLLWDLESPDIITSGRSDLTNEELHAIIVEHEPDASVRYNIGDRRKLIRAVAMIEEGLSLDEFDIDRIRERRPRYHSLVLFTKTDMSVLETRITRRCDEMLDEGLLEELIQYTELYMTTTGDHTLDNVKEYECGLTQSIGFKEYLPFLKAYFRHDEPVQYHKKVISECLKTHVRNTVKFARVQIKQAALFEETGIPFLFIDTTSALMGQSSFKDVIDGVCTEVEAIGESDIDMNAIAEANEVKARRRLMKKSVMCDICGVEYPGIDENAHLNSRKHKNALKRIRELDDPDASDVLTVLRRMVSIPTVSGDLDMYKLFIKYVTNICNHYEWEYEIVFDYAIHITFEADVLPEDGKSAIFYGHYDVVPPGQGWSVDPFDSVLKKGKLYGRGTQDMKCVLAALVTTFAKRDFELMRTIHVLMVPDEEIGGFKPLFRDEAGSDFLNGLNPCVWIDEGFPGHDSVVLCDGEVSPCWVKGVFRGPQVHGSTISDELASTKLRKLITCLDNHEELHYNFVHLNSPLIANNVVPPSLEFQIDARVQPGHDLLKLYTDIEDCFGENDEIEYLDRSMLNPRSERTPTFDLIQESIRLLGTNVTLSTFPACTDARFARQQGIPAYNVSYQPGEPVLAHQKDECLSVRNLIDSLEFYKHILKNI
ncbi:hypothetical protein PCE1_000995 [Barthelona sp. PCE]